MFNHCAVHLSIRSIKSIRFRVKNPVAWYQGTLIMFSSDYESFQIKSLKTSDQITTEDYNQRGNFPFAKEENNKIKVRVGKCHGYDGYIRVKKLASWGKKFGRPK